MARRLPWKRSEEPLSTKRSPSVKPPRSPAPASASRPSAVHSPSLTPIVKKPRRERVLDEPERIRSPSTSPPPEPPKEELMTPGLLHDDRYRMVEDEFLTTAQRFTTHLHRAEYDRLKSLAKSQNAATIEEIERPVVGTPTFTAKKRQESVKRALKQQKLLKDDSDNSIRLSSLGTNLQGLMGSPRKEARTISSSFPRTTTTRASAGFVSSLEKRNERGSSHRHSVASKRAFPARDQDDADTEGDDETTSPRRSDIRSSSSRPISAARARPSKPPSHAADTPNPSTRAFQRRSVAMSQHSSPLAQSSEPRPRRSLDDDDNDDDDPFGINKRRIHRQKSREQQPRKQPLKEDARLPRKRSPDTIPTFL